MKKTAALLLATLAVAGCATTGTDIASDASQRLEAKLFETTIVMEVKANYLLYLPDGYEASTQDWPLVLFLHGAGERGDNIKRVKEHGPAKNIAAGELFPFIMIAPQCPRGDSWSSSKQLASLNATKAFISLAAGP